MQRFTVVLDACVLVPVTAADTLLRLAEREMYRPVWSEGILVEAKRAVARLHPEIEEEQVEYRFACMNKAFEDASISGWESLEGSIVLPDEDDRHIVACALIAGADAIVTNNVRDFPHEVLAPLRIEIISLRDPRTGSRRKAPPAFSRGRSGQPRGRGCPRYCGRAPPLSLVRVITETCGCTT
jgi:predicted nucleic acid-binding protein